MLPAAFLLFGLPLLVLSLPQEEPAPTLRREKTPQGERILLDPEMTLEQFILEAGRILGRGYQWKAEAQALLGSTLRVTGFRSVPAADFESFFEQMLLAYDFLAVPPPESSALPWKIYYLKGSDRQNLRSFARYVPVEEIEKYRSRVILLTTGLRLRYLEAQRAVNNLRALFPDQTIETITTIGDTVVLSGFASNVAIMATLLKEADVEAEAQKAPALPPGKPAAPGHAAPSGATRDGDLEARLKGLEDSVDSLRQAVRDLAAALRR